MLEKIKALIRALNPKAVVKAAAKKAVQEEGDALQKALKEAIVREGPQAVDRVMDAAQAALISRIDAL
jgi:hypothetical protein